MYADVPAPECGSRRASRAAYLQARWTAARTQDAAVGKTTHCHQSGGPCNDGAPRVAFAPTTDEVRCRPFCARRTVQCFVNEFSTWRGTRSTGAQRCRVAHSDGAAVHCQWVVRPIMRPLFANNGIVFLGGALLALQLRAARCTPLRCQLESTPTVGTVPGFERVETALRARAGAPDCRAARMAGQLIFR